MALFQLRHHNYVTEKGHQNYVTFFHLTLLLPTLISGPNLGAWPDCWVSAEFLCTPIF